jgi:hypothetical protein
MVPIPSPKSNRSETPSAMLCDKDDWREAAERAFPDFYDGIL